MYHVANSGELAPCRATQRECPKSHFDTRKEYETHLEQKHGMVHTIASPIRQISISYNMGTVIVQDGDLHDPAARIALSGGRCMDLALAIHEKTGKPMFLLTHVPMTKDELQAIFSSTPNIVHTATHVVTQSEHYPDEYVDSYGRNTMEDLDDRYGGVYAVEATPEMVRHYAGQDSIADQLSRFADTARELDRDELLYDFNEVDFDEYEGDDS